MNVNKIEQNMNMWYFTEDKHYEAGCYGYYHSYGYDWIRRCGDNVDDGYWRLGCST